MAPEIAVKELLEAGVHFGHQTSRWNPKMRPYIFTARDGIHIIDLEQTAHQAVEAHKFIADTVALGQSVLFVGTKKQAQDPVEAEAKRANQFYVTRRWLGGMLTNFQTIKQSIGRLNDLIAKKEKGEFEKLPKKEALQLEREMTKLHYSLDGIKDMAKLPGVVFLIDPNHEKIAKLEALKLGIPIVALIDTNSSPDGIDYLIAGNDDAIRSIAYFTKLIADACEEGSRRREAALREQQARAAEERPAGKPRGPAVREQKIEGKGKAWVGRREEGPVSQSDVERFASAKVEPAEPVAPAAEKPAEEKAQ
jgi:small subunit ribosomal protein S2